jgi:tRNA pseudouridine55 synthase
MEKIDYLAGQLLLINKPLTWTSFDVVKKVRNGLRAYCGVKKIKVGHAGTLDPLADGLLIICTGKFTKKIDEYQAQEKEYTGTFTLGQTTPSYDLETKVNETFSTEHINEKLIQQTTTQFIGEITQVPPIYSAIKQDGVRLYEHARSGVEVKIKERRVTIQEFEITNVEMPIVSFRVVCSKGTYIRSLANDFGAALSSGAHLSQLRRTKIGEYSLSQATDLEGFMKSMSI